MSRIKVLIIRTAGTNCDRETKTAFELLKVNVRLLHVNDLLRRREKIYNYQAVVFPGGFTYGDDIAAGKILANELKMKLKDELRAFLKKNRLMIGICNGFQVLVKMGILPGNESLRQEATLGCNDSGKFEARWTYLRKFQNGCVWTKGINGFVYIPVAHGEGKFIPANRQVLDRMKRNEQIVFQYCSSDGRLSMYPDNPNGSIEHIAGICDRTGKIFGLMPHPERFVFATQHPRWTRRKTGFLPDGLRIFRNGIEFLKKA